MQEPHQPYNANEYGHNNPSGSSGGGLGASGRGLPRDEKQMAQGYQEIGGAARYGGGLQSSGGIRNSSTPTQLTASPGRQVRAGRQPSYANALASADDEQLGGQGYGGSMQTTHYMPQ